MFAGAEGTPGFNDGSLFPVLIASPVRFNLPQGLVAAGAGGDMSLFVADSGNNVIRRITIGVFDSNKQASTFLGSSAGVAGYETCATGGRTLCQFRNPTSIAAYTNPTSGKDITLYIADTYVSTAARSVFSTAFRM